MSEPRKSDALVLFGATGDLARKMIFPALQYMVAHRDLDVRVIGVAIEDLSDEQLRERARESLESHGGVDEEAFGKLAKLLHYVSGDYTKDETFEKLRAALGDAKAPLFYMAIPPSMFETVVSKLQQAGCCSSASRLVVEKPFGRDLASAQRLNEVVHKFFDERRIFRIDHFLGKEQVENLTYFRFANSLFEPIWRRGNIHSVQITLAEDFGVSERGRFYEEAGAIRDVIQNHLFQVMAMLGMAPPSGRDVDATRDAKARFLKSVRPVSPDDLMRGQYSGYRDVAGVAPNSEVETYAAMRLWVDNWRWADVPFLVRSGKCLPVTATEVYVRMHPPPQDIFGERARALPNHLRFRLEPEVVIALGVRVKVPGETMRGETIELDAHHQTCDDMPPYARLLGDAMRGDPTNFTRQDAVMAAWEIVQPVLGNVTPVYEYEPGSWGPSQANQLAGEYGWHDPKAREPRRRRY